MGKETEELERSGVTDGDRTRDNRNHNPGLYQLSYGHHILQEDRFTEQELNIKKWGDRRGSNPRQQESQSWTLPTELRSPHCALQDA